MALTKIRGDSRVGICRIDSRIRAGSYPALTVVMSQSAMSCASRGTSEAVRHYRLAELNRIRLRPGLGDEDWRQRLELETTLRRTECQLVEEQRVIVRQLAATAPRDADDFVRWFEHLERTGPGQHDRLFDFLAEAATLEQ